MTQETGGPAFPAQHFDMADGEHGITLRDYFAAKAMQGLLETAVDWIPTGSRPDVGTLELFRELSVDSYHLADAMLEARK